VSSRFANPRPIEERIAAALQENVGRLQVAMDDLVLVRVMNRKGEGSHQGGGGLRR
jgi:hypothetical protein